MSFREIGSQLLIAVYFEYYSLKKQVFLFCNFWMSTKDISMKETALRFPERPFLRL